MKPSKKIVQKNDMVKNVENIEELFELGIKNTKNTIELLESKNRSHSSNVSFVVSAQTVAVHNVVAAR